MTNESAEDRGEWPGRFPGRWKVASFAESFDNVTSSSLKLALKEYEETGTLPVIDQGSEPVGGYTNNGSLVHPGPLPAIIFGDHTRCVKFTERPFVQGADGVKVLAPRLFEPQFSFWALKTLKLPDRGYARHFKFLKASRFPVPPLNEQRRIVAKIEDLTARSQAAKEALDAIPPLLERFRQSVLAAAFRGDLTKQWRQQNPNVEPASELLQRIRQERRQRWEQDYLDQQKAKGKTPKDDKWKEKYQEPEPVDTTGLPELPEGWCWAAGRELFTWSSGKNLPQKKQKPGPYPVYGGNGVSGLHDEYLISNSTLVIGRVGAHCGNVYWTDSKSWITDNAIYATTIVKSVNLKFSVYLFRAAKLNKKAGGSGQPFVNQPLLNELLIALPPAAEQNAIVETLEEAESVSADQTRCADGVRAQMARLNQSILAKAFRGELVPQDPNDEPASALLERIHAER